MVVLQQRHCCVRGLMSHSAEQAAQTPPQLTCITLLAPHIHQCTRESREDHLEHLLLVALEHVEPLRQVPPVVQRDSLVCAACRQHVWIVWVEGNAIHLSSVGFCCYHNTCHGRQPRNRLHSALALGSACMDVASSAELEQE